MIAKNDLIYAIVGPTASGKTAFSIEFAKRVGGEILICDAYQLRSELPILTAKPTKEEQHQIPHHLLGVLPVTQVGTAALFTKLADQVIETLHQQNKPIILCGGTGLYLRALVDGLFEGPSASYEIREQLRKEQAVLGTPVLHERLIQVDPEAAARIMQNDYVRIERALEVYLQSGKPISKWQEEGRKKGPRYQVQYIGLDPGQEVLRQKIKIRIDQMMTDGVCEEVASVIKQFGEIPSPPLGFDLVVSYLQGQLDLDLMKERFMHQTCQYAKRQRNWFRSLSSASFYATMEDALPHIPSFVDSFQIVSS